MKNIKTVIAALAIVSAGAFSANAQKVQAGPEVSLGISNPINNSQSAKLGFSAGIRAEFALSKSLEKGWFLSTGLHLASKPWKSEAFQKEKSGTDRSAVTYTSNPYYLQLPIHFGYRFHLGSACDLHIEAGPYAAVGLFGKTTTETESLISAEKPIDVKEDCFGNMYRRFEAGMNLGFGVTVKRHVQIGLNYGAAFTTMTKDGFSDSYNQTASVSVGYLF